MHHRRKQAIIWLVLVAFLAAGLLPAAGTRASSAIAHPLDDTLLLWTAGELWLVGDLDPVAAVGRAPGPLKVAAPRAGSAQQTEVAINAVKRTIAVKEHWHQVYSQELAQQGDQQLLNKLDEQYQQELAQLNAKLEELRREWRRQKRFFPKLVRGVKQAGGWVWHKLGPAGRQLFRGLGDDLLQVLVQGDPVTGQVIRILLVRRVKELGRERVERILLRVASRDRRQTPSEQPAEEPAEGPAEPGETASFEEIWTSIEALLQLERRNCHRASITYLRDCIQQAGQASGDWSAAPDACDAIYQQIPPNDPGGMVAATVSLDLDSANQTHRGGLTLQYPTAGGPVTGRYERVNQDTFVGCQFTSVATLSGTYDPTTCRFTGTAQVSYRVEPLMPLTGYGVEKREDCFKTANYRDMADFSGVSYPWAAELNDGEVDGAIGEEGGYPSVTWIAINADVVGYQNTP